MLWRRWICITMSWLGLVVGGQAEEKPAPKIAWKKTVLDKAFRSEGVAVADVNKDGKLDVLVGDVWYEAPDWKVHVIRKDRTFNPLNYSECFACWADDINKDGWPDLVVVGFPGKACHWYENPQNKPGPWKEHFINESACNETPQYLDLFGTGRRVLLMGTQVKGEGGQMAWFEPAQDPTKPWIRHSISGAPAKGQQFPGTAQFSHGLGASDVNGDGRLDVITTGGWWEQPAKDDGQPWTFHKVGIGENCADMHAVDVDGDGKRDVISSSAHSFGIWWHQQVPSKDKNSPMSFVKRDLFPKLFSQSHALLFVDINGDGLKDLVTGRRWWAHGPKGDPGSDGPAVLYWFQAKKSSDGSLSFVPHQIDDDSGIGTQFMAIDMNGDGLLDIVVSNKKGVCISYQVREANAAPPANKE